MTGFVPDPNSRTSQLVDFVVENLTEVGAVVTYHEAAGVIGFEGFTDSPKDRNVIQKIVSGVNNRLKTAGDWRLLVASPNVGYRIASPAEIHDVYSSRMIRSTRQQSRSLSAVMRVIIHPDATPEDRKRATDVAAAQGELLGLMRRRQRSMRGVWRRPETSPTAVE